MIRKILVALDGSTFGEHALPWAISLANRLNADLYLAHVHRTLEATYAELQVFDETLDSEIRSREVSYLREIQAKIKSAIQGEVVVANREGDVGPALCEYAQEIHADLMLMTTHARGAFARFWLGSVADEMVRTVPIPLILVHPKQGAPDLKAVQLFRNILVPLDGSTHAEKILPAACELAKAVAAELTLVRVVKPVAPMIMATEVGVFGEMASQMIDRIENAQLQIKKDARTYLDNLSDKLRGEGFTVHVHLTVEDQPGSAILNYAKAPVDCIALETHGRGGVSRMFMGSVADKVVRGSELPILVQRSK